MASLRAETCGKKAAPHSGAGFADLCLTTWLRRQGVKSHQNTWGSQPLLSRARTVVTEWWLFWCGVAQDHRFGYYGTPVSERRDVFRNLVGVGIYTRAEAA